jgi:DNA-binding CsgD family transcriptional regulator
LDWLDGVAYLTDSSRVIVAVGKRNWSRFATENGAPGLASAETVLGRNVLDFVEGDAVRSVYSRALAALARGGAPAVVFPFRCDAPGVRRDLRMAITLVRRGIRPAGFLFQSILLESATRPKLALFDFAQHAKAASGGPARRTVTICSFCQRVLAAEKRRAGTNDWIEAEIAQRELPRTGIRVQHRACPRCDARWAALGLGRGTGMPLSRRQIDVLRLMIEGHPNRTIATKLSMSENTVKTHLKAMFERLGARNRTDAVQLALRIWPDLRR